MQLSMGICTCLGRPSGSVPDGASRPSSRRAGWGRSGCHAAGMLPVALLLMWMLLVSQPAQALSLGRNEVRPGASEPKRPERIDLARAQQAAQSMADQVLGAADAGGLPFAVVDKNNALLSIYRGDGRLAGSTPVLLGRMPGDQATPGVGDRAQGARLKLSDRTTPAGRFAAEPGRNRSGEAIIWLDYNNALAIHRLRPSPASEQRAQRLVSPWPTDHLITAGCVVVPVAFYDNVVQQILGHSKSVVYVLGQAGQPRLPQHLQAQVQSATPPNP